jgi:hypothetical protein
LDGLGLDGLGLDGLGLGGGRRGVVPVRAGLRDAQIVPLGSDRAQPRYIGHEPEGRIWLLRAQRAALRVFHPGLGSSEPERTDFGFSLGPRRKTAALRDDFCAVTMG